MTHEKSPFETFYLDPIYVNYKKHLYNYRLRRANILREVAKSAGQKTLEVGAGITPMLTPCAQTTYVDLSENAIHYLKNAMRESECLRACATKLPFNAGAFDLVVCSEVLEHIEDDRAAIAEFYRVLKPGGKLVITVPAHGYLFASDDRLVKHCRRYSPNSLKSILEQEKFTEIHIKKVAGLLDKIFMILAAFAFKRLVAASIKSEKFSQKPHPILHALFPFYFIFNRIYYLLCRLEAKIVPLSLTTIIQLSARRPS